MVQTVRAGAAGSLLKVDYLMNVCQGLGNPAKEGLFVLRLKFPANYRVPPHTHPVDEIITVISGEFNIGMGKQFDEGQTEPFTAGGLVAMPPGMEHFVYTETVIQISSQGP